MKRRLSQILVVTGLIIYFYPSVLDVNIPSIIISTFTTNWAMIIIVIGFLLSNSQNKRKSR